MVVLGLRFGPGSQPVPAQPVSGRLVTRRSGSAVRGAEQVEDVKHAVPVVAPALSVVTPMAPVAPMPPVTGGRSDPMTDSTVVNGIAFTCEDGGTVMVTGSPYPLRSRLAVTPSWCFFVSPTQSRPPGPADPTSWPTSWR